LIVGWRLTKEKLISEAFSGMGARIYGGRWNHKGILVVYIGGSIALAALEGFVHLDKDGKKIKFAYLRVEIPDSVKVKEISTRSLPKNWRDEPAPKSTKDIGTDWAERLESVILKIPSVLIPAEYNYILNPLHSDFPKLIIGKPIAFSFDPRMWK
jgi:RES domain-containing protein